MLDFLFSVLEYDLSPSADGAINSHYTAALQRALAIKHCKVRSPLLAVGVDGQVVRVSDTFCCFFYEIKYEFLLVCSSLLEK